MAKRKIEDEYRIFQDSWEIEFFCISGKKHDALCLICRKTINIPKRYNINRHYTTHHTEFSKNYPHPSKIREEKLIELKKGIFSEKQSILRFTNKNELATKASYEVTHMLAKRMKPFSDAELIKKCMETVVNTLFCNFSNFKEIRDQLLYKINYELKFKIVIINPNIYVIHVLFPTIPFPNNIYI